MVNLDYFQKAEIELAKKNNIDLTVYADQGFDWTQMEEIRLGLVNHVDISLYARQEYVSLQMKEIRLGLEKKVDIHYYMDPEFDWFQMEEIRLGLESDLDVDLYARKEYDHLCMKQIRIGLMDGINLVPFIEKGYRSNILREIREARRFGVDLEPYLGKRYDSDQLHEIWESLRSGVDIMPYISTTTAGSQMREIRLGLEHHVNVEEYHASEYNWFQMQEIRLGLEAGLEVFWYTSPYFTHEQMREIRLGLMEGANVTFYATFMYSATDMRKTREWMKQNGEPEKAVAAEGHNELDILPVETTVTISQDGMSATMVLAQPAGKQKYVIEDLLAVLQDKGVKQGILREVLSDMIEKGRYREEVEVARGKESKDGTDGRYEWRCRTEMPIVPKLLPDGSVDYKNIDFFEEVKEDQKIAVYYPPTVGVYGYKVTGVLKAPRRGKELPKLSGTGFRLDPEEHTYYSLIDGRIDIRSYHVLITPLYTYYGDVTSSVGNIRFQGDIQIKGYVGSGVTIEAGGDLVIDGNVEAAVLKADKNIMIKSGVCGAYEGVIQAGENISGKYFEAVRLIANRDIRSNYLLNCESTAQGKIVISGKKGAIVGGVSHSIFGITSYLLGNAAELKTVLDIGMNEVFTKEFTQLDEQAIKIESEISIFRKSMQKFEATHTLEELAGLTVYEKMQQAMVIKQEEFNELRQKQTDMVRNIQFNRKLIQVRAMGTAYPGCVVRIDRCALKVTTTANQVLFKHMDNRVAAFSGRV